MEEKNRFEEQMEKMRIVGLEQITHKLFRTTPRGRKIAIVYLFIAIGSIFLYAMVFKLNIFLSVLLALITWFVVTYIGDKIIVKIYRVDKQFDWFFNTQEGLNELRKGGLTNEQIAELKKTVEDDSMYKKYSLDNYKKIQ